MTRDVQIGVKFVGYSAIIVTKENVAEVNRGSIDFITGSVSLIEDDGVAIATSRTHLGAFIRSLPNRAAELQERANRMFSSANETHHTFNVSELGDVCVRLPTDLHAFIRQLAKRFKELEQVIDEAWDIGCRIIRRPYDEFVEETRQTGVQRIEVHGSGLVIAGHLIFHPSKQTSLVRPRVGQPATFEVELQKPRAAVSPRVHLKSSTKSGSRH